MPFEAAKCPSCGASIQVPTETVSAKCMFCGSTLIVKEAIQKLKIEIGGQIRLAGISTAENDIERGNQCLTAKDWQSAYKVFCESICKQANNYFAWMGCLAAITQNYNRMDYSWVSYDGGFGIEAIVNNCIVYSNQDHKQEAKYRIEQLIDLMINAIDEDASPKIQSAEKSRRSSAIALMFVAVLEILLGIFAPGFLKIMCFIVGIIALIVSFVKLRPINKNKFRNQTWISYADKINIISESI